MQHLSKDERWKIRGSWEKSCRRLWRCLILAFLRLRREIMFHRRSLVVAYMCLYIRTRNVLTSTRPSLHDNLYNVIIGGYVSARRGRRTFHKYTQSRSRRRYFTRFENRGWESQLRIVERQDLFYGSLPGRSRNRFVLNHETEAVNIRRKKIARLYLALVESTVR